MAQQGLAALTEGRLLLFTLGWPTWVAQASRCDANHYLWLIDLHSRWDLGSEQGGRAAALGHVRARVVLLGSSDDEFITPRSTRADGRSLQAASVASRVEIFHGAHGHFSCIEDTGAFAATMAAEVKRVTP
jgi:homoserine acetyltransferase